jgi:sulfur carrier protein ThiS
MVVTVYLHTILQRQTHDGPQRQLDVTLLSGSTMANLLQDLGIDFSTNQPLLLVNGRVAKPGDILKQGDQIHLIPVSP